MKICIYFFGDWSGTSLVTFMCQNVRSDVSRKNGNLHSIPHLILYF